MSLFCRSLRPPTTDDAVERYLASLRSRVEPDPLFRRRLRSQAINRFVAASEQMRTDSARAMARQMGRIGRACLYASVAVATSAAGVLGASQGALPGDALYGVKLRIEQLRFQVIPAHLQGVLSANVLAERLGEMTRLLDVGRTADAVALQPAIAAEIEHLVAVEAVGGPDAENRIANHLLVLDELIAGLPANPGAAVRAAWEQLPSNSAGVNASGPAGAAGTPGASGGAHGDGQGNGGASGAGGRIDPPRHEPNPSAPGQVTSSPQATHAPDQGRPDDSEARVPGHGKPPSPGVESSD